MPKLMSAGFALVLAVASAPLPPASELVLGPLRIGTTTADAKRLIGHPISAKKKSGFITTVYEYRELTLYFDEDSSLSAVDSKSSKYCLDGWACIGKPFGEIRRHAMGLNSDVVAGAVTIYRDSCWAVLKEKKGVLAQIHIQCAP